MSRHNNYSDKDRRGVDVPINYFLGKITISLIKINENKIRILIYNNFNIIITNKNNKTLSQ